MAKCCKHSPSSTTFGQEKVIKKVTKKRKTPHTNTEDAAMLRRISEQQKRMATIAQMGSTKAFAVEAVNRCGYNDVNTCNYIFAKILLRRCLVIVVFIVATSVTTIVMHK